ncbi:hypothetical protein WDU94_013357 [Cyamophila willieti]
MALWLRAQKIKEVRDIYGGQFPLEVRDFLSTWIEDKAWSDIDLDNAQHAQYATSLVNNLVQELENQVNIMARNPGGVNLLLGLKLQDVHRNFKVSLLSLRCMCTKISLCKLLSTDRYKSQFENNLLLCYQYILWPLSMFLYISVICDVNSCVWLSCGGGVWCVCVCVCVCVLGWCVCVLFVVGSPKALAASTHDSFSIFNRLGMSAKTTVNC